MARKTHKQYAAEMLPKNIKPLEKYNGDGTNILHQCMICSYEWSPKPTNALKVRACPKCVRRALREASIKKSNIDYIEQLSSRLITPLEHWQGSTSIILHLCGVCNHEWKASPGNVKSGTGCPKCSGKYQPTPSEYAQEVLVLNKNIIVIDDYVNAYTKIQHQCNICDNKWSVAPTSIRSGYGCPKCANSRSAKEKYSGIPTWLYYIKIPSKNIFKVGIAMDRNGGTVGRYNHEPFEIEIIQEKLFSDGYEAWTMEQKIIMSNKRFAWTPKLDEKFGGWTECFNTNISKKKGNK